MSPVKSAVDQRQKDTTASLEGEEVDQSLTIHITWKDSVVYATQTGSLIVTNTAGGSSIDKSSDTGKSSLIGGTSYP